MLSLIDGQYNSSELRLSHRWVSSPKTRSRSSLHLLGTATVDEKLKRFLDEKLEQVEQMSKRKSKLDKEIDEDFCFESSQICSFVNENVLAFLF